MGDVSPLYAKDLALSLPVSWQVLPFDKLVFFQEGPGIRNWQYVDDGVPFVNIRCLVNGRLDRASMSSVSKEEAYGKYQHFLLDADDYVVSSSGTLGRIATVRDEDLPCMLNTSVIRMRPRNSRLDRGYLRYFLLSNYYQDQIVSFATGSAQLNYGPSHLRQMFIVAPPESEQRAIAAVLDALDDKIEQNRRTARVLERLARAIFRAWFVDFEPVHAKAAGATGLPSMPREVFDALPTRFVDSEIGLVPEGWEVKAVATIATFLNGLALQKYPPRGDREDLPVIKIAQLRKGSTEGAAWANGDVPDQYVIDDRDLLFSWSGTLEAEFWFGGTGALNQHLFKVTSSDFPIWFCFQWIREHLPWFRTVAASRATTMGHIKRGHLKEAQVVVPTADVLRGANGVIGPLYDLHAQLMGESRRLAGTRDYLLPKLLSGEVRARGLV